MFEAVYKHHAVVCISILMLHINLRLVDLNIYFYDVFFNYKMGSEKGYIERGGFFYCKIHMKCDMLKDFILRSIANISLFLSEIGRSFLILYIKSVFT